MYGMSLFNIIFIYLKPSIIMFIGSIMREFNESTQIHYIPIGFIYLYVHIANIYLCTCARLYHFFYAF